MNSQLEIKSNNSLLPRYVCMSKNACVSGHERACSVCWCVLVCLWMCVNACVRIWAWVRVQVKASMFCFNECTFCPLMCELSINYTTFETCQCGYFILSHLKLPVCRSSPIYTYFPTTFTLVSLLLNDNSEMLKRSIHLLFQLMVWKSRLLPWKREAIRGIKETCFVHQGVS